MAFVQVQAAAYITRVRTSCNDDDNVPTCRCALGADLSRTKRIRAKRPPLQINGITRARDTENRIIRAKRPLLQMYGEPRARDNGKGAETCNDWGLRSTVTVSNRLSIMKLSCFQIEHKQHCDQPLS